MLESAARTVLGAVTGLITLVALLRLILAGLGNPSPALWAVVSVGLIPWVVYLALRARRARWPARRGPAIAVLNAIGLVLIWLGTGGPVFACLVSLIAAALIWAGGLPARLVRDTHFVRIDELRADD